MPKSEDELQSEIDDLKSKVEALANSKADILDEKKKLEKKYKEFDSDEYFKLRDDFDKLDTEHKKLEKANNGLTKDFEKANQTIAEKDGSLSKLLIDDGIAKTLNALDKHKLNDGALELATMAIKSKGVVLNDDGVPMIGDKAMSDYITNDFLSDPSSKNLVTPNENSGGGAGGGNGGNNNSQKRSDMSKSEKGNFIAENGNDAYLALPN